MSALLLPIKRATPLGCTLHKRLWGRTQRLNDGLERERSGYPSWLIATCGIKNSGPGHLRSIRRAAI